MDHFHTRTHKLKGNISPDIQENIKYTTQIMQDCNDLVQKQFKIGIDHEISIYIVYMDGLVNTEMLQESVIRPLLQDSFPQERTCLLYTSICDSWNDHLYGGSHVLSYRSIPCTGTDENSNDEPHHDITIRIY